MAENDQIRLVIAFEGGQVIGGTVTPAVSKAFQEAMAVTTYAGVILAIRQVLAAPLGYARETTSSATSLGAIFSSFDGTSPVARFFGALDVFVIWWAIVLAIGVSVLYHRRARTIVVAFLGAYAAVALLLATAMTVTGGSV